MKKTNLLFFFLLIFGVCNAQEKLSKEEQARREKNIQAGNPFAKYGYKAKVATLSNGKYLEFHDLDSIVTIGTMRWHVDKNQIVGQIELDTLNPDHQPIGDRAGRWMSPDPLSEEFPDYSPYNFCFNNPMRFVDPDGMAPVDWIPQIQITKDDKGKISGGQLIAKPEKGDTPETLAKFLSIDQKEAKKIYNGNKNVIVPNNIAKPINEAITHSIMNPEQYIDYKFTPMSLDENYNCFSMTLSISQDKTPDTYNTTTSPDIFENQLNTNYNKVQNSEYQFGKTAISFTSKTSFFGFFETNIVTHGAIYLGTSNNGTIYTFTKNGFINAPGVMKLNNLNYLYGSTSGFYNYDPK